MTHRERMLAALQGKPTDLIPWAPRMDLWCIANRERGTLPVEFEGLDTPGMADALGVACHAVRADFTRDRRPEDYALRGLGIENQPDAPYRVELHDLPMEFHHEGNIYRTRIRTSAGEISFTLSQTAAMRRDGISIPYVQEFAIRSVNDFAAMAEIFEHLEVIPTPEAYADFRQRVGERGLAVAYASLGASPMHGIFHDMVSQEEFFYLYEDDRAALTELAQRMEPFYDRTLEAAVHSSAEAFYWGSNYDQGLTPPRFFQAEITPWLQRAADRAHAAGKLLLTHTDGENQLLLPLYPACRFDIAESVCPQPMTRNTLQEVREGMGPHVTVWGGIPSVALLKDQMDEAAFEHYLDELFGSLGTGERLILGVADNVPPDADLTRLHRIKERVEAFGPVRPTAT